MSKNQKNSIDNLKQKYSNDNNYKREVLLNVITKKATGYVLEEITEEFLLDESGEMKLAKRKITAKEIGPDLNCVKALEEIKKENNNYENMTDEELQKEKTRLINLILQEEESGG